MAANVVEILVKARDDATMVLEKAAHSAQGTGKAFGSLGLAAGAVFGGGGALSMAGPLGAAGIAMGAFGAIAIPTVTRVEGQVKKLQAAQLAYNTATTKASKAAAKAHLDAIKATLSGSDMAMADVLDKFKTMFKNLGEQFVPLITGVLKLGVALLKNLKPALDQLVPAGAKIIGEFIRPLISMLKSDTFKRFTEQVVIFGVQMGKLAGPVIANLLKALMQLFIQTMPAGLKILQTLLPAIVRLVIAMTPLIVITSKVVAALLPWLDHMHLLVPLLGLALGALIAMKLGLLASFAAFKETATGARILSLAMDAMPWVALAAAILVVTLLIIKYHKQIWEFIKRIWNDVYKFIKGVWNDILGFAKQWWPLIFGAGGLIIKYHQQIWDFIRRIWNDIFGFFKRIWNDILGAVRDAAGKVKSFLSSAWNQMFDSVRNVWGNIVDFFRKMPGRLIGALFGLGHSLYSFAHDVVSEFWNGAKSVAGGVVNWFKGFGKSVLHAIGSIFHFGSPSKTMFKYGEWIVDGMHNGVKSKLSGFLSSVHYKVGAGVAQWAGLVRKALSMEGLPQSLAGRVLYQMQTESGGNPNAINLTDSNAAAGDPSRGLLQTIMSTFRAYHWPGTSSNIYDPLANIAAAINYARHAYGPSLMSGGMGMGSGHGYASGGIAGGIIRVGEHGTELIKVPQGSYVYPHGAGPAGGGGVTKIVLEVGSGGKTDFERAFVSLIRQWVRVKGGGDVQTAFGVSP